MHRGYFGILLVEPKTIENLGTIFRSAFCFNANFIATIGTRYKRDRLDTPDSIKHIPYFNYPDFPSFFESRPLNAKLIGVEVSGEENLKEFVHPERAIYIFGGEDRSIPSDILVSCDYTVKMETKSCLNLGVCASIIMYDRSIKQE